jgi:hypothetical protein
MNLLYFPVPPRAKGVLRDPSINAGLRRPPKQSNHNEPAPIGNTVRAHHRKNAIGFVGALRVSELADLDVEHIETHEKVWSSIFRVRK